MAAEKRKGNFPAYIHNVSPVSKLGSSSGKARGCSVLQHLQLRVSTALETLKPRVSPLYNSRLCSVGSAPLGLTLAPSCISQHLQPRYALTYICHSALTANEEGGSAGRLRPAQTSPLSGGLLAPFTQPVGDASLLFLTHKDGAGVC